MELDCNGMFPVLCLGRHIIMLTDEIAATVLIGAMLAFVLALVWGKQLVELIGFAGGIAFKLPG
jgi:hypothetical protein